MTQKNQDGTGGQLNQAHLAAGFNEPTDSVIKTQVERSPDIWAPAGRSCTEARGLIEGGEGDRVVVVEAQKCASLGIK